MLSAENTAKIEKASRPPSLYPFWRQVVAADRFVSANFAAFCDRIEKKRGDIPKASKALRRNAEFSGESLCAVLILAKLRRKKQKSVGMEIVVNR